MAPYLAALLTDIRKAIIEMVWMSNYIHKNALYSFTDIDSKVVLMANILTNLDQDSWRYIASRDPSGTKLGMVSASQRQIKKM